jgi:hypothetical protein
MLSVNFFCNINSYDILAYITKNYRKNAMTKRKDNTTIDTQNITATAKD